MHFTSSFLLPILLATPSVIGDFLVWNMNIVTCTPIEGGDTICEGDDWYKGATTVADWTTDCSKQPNPVSIGELDLDGSDPITTSFDPPICGNSQVTFESAGGDQWLAVGENGAGMGVCSPANSTEVVDPNVQGFFVCVKLDTSNIYTVHWDCQSDTCS